MTIQELDKRLAQILLEMDNACYDEGFDGTAYFLSNLEDWRQQWKETLDA